MTSRHQHGGAEADSDDEHHHRHTTTPILWSTTPFLAKNSTQSQPQPPPQQPATSSRPFASHKPPRQELKEWCDRHHLKLTYDDEVEKEGFSHDPTFTILVQVKTQDDTLIASGRGSGKKISMAKDEGCQIILNKGIIQSWTGGSGTTVTSQSWGTTTTSTREELKMLCDRLHYRMEYVDPIQEKSPDDDAGGGGGDLVQTLNIYDAYDSLIMCKVGRGMKLANAREDACRQVLAEVKGAPQGGASTIETLRNAQKRAAMLGGQVVEMLVMLKACHKGATPVEIETFKQQRLNRQSLAKGQGPAVVIKMNELIGLKFFQDDKLVDFLHAMDNAVKAVDPELHEMIAETF